MNTFARRCRWRQHHFAHTYTQRKVLGLNISENHTARWWYCVLWWSCPGEGVITTWNTNEFTWGINGGSFRFFFWTIFMKGWLEYNIQQRRTKLFTCLPHSRHSRRSQDSNLMGDMWCTTADQKCTPAVKLFHWDLHASTYTAVSD
jgi:hypothetical protein